MRRVRATFRALSLAAITASVYLSWWCLDRLLVVAPRRRPAVRRAVMQRWCRAMFRALGGRIQVRGAPPPAGSFLVSNHLGYLDILVIGASTRSVFVSKSEVARWPVIGKLASDFGTLYVERGNKRSLPEINERIEDALARGEGVVVFPEGTSTRGESVLPFRPPLLAPPAATGRAVYSATLRYSTAPSDPPASLAVCWWGDMLFLPHLKSLLLVDSIEAELEFDPEPVRSADRKELAEKLWHKVNSHFRPVP